MNLKGLYQTVIEHAINTQQSHLDFCTPFQKMKERTYNLNFGRQTGKTQAIVESIHDNAFNYNCIVIAKNNNRLQDILERLQLLREPYEKSYSYGNERTQLKRTFGFSENKLEYIIPSLRGHNLSRKILVFIDEPFDSKSTTKILNELYEKLGFLPDYYGAKEVYFFVIGAQ